MGLLTNRTGDLFFSNTKALAHGVNIRGVMGAGVAKQFRMIYPEMYGAYQRECRNGSLRPGGVFAWHDDESDRWVYNLATQDEPGPYARIEWVRSSVVGMVGHAEANGVTSIALPRIASQIGGLHWPLVQETLVEIARQTTVKIEVWHLPARA